MHTLHVALYGLLVGCACTNPSRPLPEDSSAQTEPSTPPEAGAGNDAGSSSPEVTRMRITVGSTVFSAMLADSTTARAFAAILPLTLDMKDVNANEKFYELPSSLPL